MATPKVGDWNSWVQATVTNAKVALQLGRWARWTSKRVARGELHNVHQPEESLTSSLLLDLCLSVPSLRVRALNKNQESKEGADWEWWIQGQHRWFGALVQAKRLTQKSAYDFGRTTRGTGRRQVDVLIETAAAKRIAPLYALYNDTTDRHRRFSSHHCAQDRLLPKGSSGVTIVSALHIRNLADSYGTRHVPAEEVTPYAIPWSCLASCPSVCRFGSDRTGSATVSVDLSDREPAATDPAVQSAWMIIRLASGSDDRIRAALTDSIHPQQRYHADVQGLRRQPPGYVLRLGELQDMETVADPKGWEPEAEFSSATVDRVAGHDLPRFVVALFRD